jgi:hypothetical protein
MRIYRLRIAAAALCVASIGSLAIDTEVLAATRRTTTKPKKKPRKTTTTRKRVTTKPVVTIPASSTLPAGATELDKRNAAIKDVYDRYKALYVKMSDNKTLTPVVPEEGKTILTGKAYENLVEYEMRVLATGLYFVNTKFESIDFRIESSSTSSAVIRVCDRISDSGARKKSDNSVATNPVPVVVNDREYELVYSTETKRWFISLVSRLNVEEDKSKCGDGK